MGAALMSQRRELQAQSRQLLTKLVVHLAREATPLFFLRGHETAHQLDPLLLGLPAILDVCVRTEPLHGLPLLVRDRHPTAHKPAVAPVTSAYTLLHFIRRAVCPGLLPRGLDVRHVVGMKRRPTAASPQFFRRESRVINQPLVRIADRTVPAKAPHVVRD